MVFTGSSASKDLDLLQMNDTTHRNAAMSLLLPGKVIHLNAQLALRKFRGERGYKAGAVRGLEELEKNQLGRLISIKGQIWYYMHVYL